MMRTLVCALVMVAASAAPAFAEQAASATSRASDASTRAARTVYICDASTMTKRAFARQFGVVEFVKAEAVVAKGEAWSTPKCMTANEVRRLKQLASLR